MDVGWAMKMIHTYNSTDSVRKARLASRLCFHGQQMEKVAPLKLGELISKPCRQLAMLGIVFFLSTAFAWVQAASRWTLLVNETDQKTTSIDVTIALDGAAYRLAFTKSGTENYNAFCIGFYSQNSWIIWDGNGWRRPVSSDSTRLAQLNSLRTAASPDIATTQPARITQSITAPRYYPFQLDGIRVARNITVNTTGWFTVGSQSHLPIDLSRLAELTSGAGQLVVGLRGGLASRVFTDAILIQWKPEFFTGESALFEARSGTYEQKAMALLGLFFYLNAPQLSFDAAVRRLYPNLMTLASWSMFNDLSESDRILYLGRMTSAIKAGLDACVSQRSIEGQSNQASIFDLNGRNSFWNLNIYIAAYLAFLEDRSYPLLVDQSCYEFNDNTLRDDSLRPLAYDSDGSPDEGRALAEAALRYYTWGVEYLVASDDQSPRLRRGANLYALLGAAAADERRIVTSPWFNMTNVGRTQNYYLAYGSNTLSSPGGQGATIGLPQENGIVGAHLNLASMSIAHLLNFRTPNGGIYSPLPFAPLGIDSPRTFAYKMHLQREAFVLLRGAQVLPQVTTMPNLNLPRPNRGADYENPDDQTTEAASYINPSYLTTMRLAPRVENGGITVQLQNQGTSIRPFEIGAPQSRAIGSVGNGITAPAGSYARAGVDSYGLLTGCIAQTDWLDQIEGLNGKQAAKNLDSYYRLNRGVGGIDQSGVPLYDISRPDAFLYTRRFNAHDLERCSVVIANISSLRPGDLLVRNGAGLLDKDPPHVGIVVGILGTNPIPADADPRQYWQNVLVVSVREGFQQVTLGTWGNGTNSFGGFTSQPESYHMRRLIKNSEVNPASLAFQAPAWDILNRTVASADLNVARMFEHTRAGSTTEIIRERWIPNTGEFLVIEPQVTMKNRAGAVVDGSNQTYEFIITGALDRRPTPVPADAQTRGNIINNDAQSVFELAAVDIASGEYWQLGELQPVLQGGTTVSRYEFVVNPQSVFYDEDMQLKDAHSGFFLSNRLASEVDGQEFNGVRGCLVSATRQFTDLRLGIRPKNQGAALPGDDLLLTWNLRLAGSNSTLMVEDQVFNERDYVAVYDKRMLWRANLYINEGINDDWNNLHPWNAPPNASLRSGGDKLPYWGYAQIHTTTGQLIQNRLFLDWDAARWGYNEWNWANPEPTEVPSVPGTGEQITIRSWVKGFINERGNQQVHNAVAYGYGQQSSPFSFNWGMEMQDYLRERLKTLLVHPESTIPPPSLPSEQVQDWHDYLFPARRIKAFNVDFRYERMTDAELREHLGELSPEAYIAAMPEIFNFPITNPQLQIIRTKLIAFYNTTGLTKSTYVYYNTISASESPTIFLQPSPAVTQHRWSVPNFSLYQVDQNISPSGSDAARRTALNAQITRLLDGKPMTFQHPDLFETLRPYYQPRVPAVPGLTTYLAFEKSEFNPIVETSAAQYVFPGNYHWDQDAVRYTLGTDCTGFLMQATGYRANQYIVGVYDGSSPPRLHSSKYYDTIGEDGNPIYSRQLARSLYHNALDVCRYAVPGDVLARFDHVMILQNVDESWMELDVGTINDKTIEKLLENIIIIQNSGYEVKNNEITYFPFQVSVGPAIGYVNSYNGEDVNKYYRVLRLSTE